MTKSNDNDPSTSSEKEEVSKNEGVETPKAPKADVASDAPAAEDKPDWLIATGDDAPTSEASESDDSSSTTTEEQDSAEQTDGEWSPSSVPQRDRSRGELPYYGGRGRTGEAGTKLKPNLFRPSQNSIERPTPKMRMKKNNSDSLRFLRTLNDSSSLSRFLES